MRDNRFLTLVVSLVFVFTATFSQAQTFPLTKAFHYSTSNDQYVSAHRGGRFIHGFPENALETFKHTHSNIPESFIECDVAETKDKTLVLMHDATLDRTTTLSGKLTDFNWEDIKDTHLVDDFGQETQFKIPRFDKILQWAKKRRIVLQVDIKRGVSFANVIHTLEKYQMEQQVIIITYNLKDARKAYKLNNKLLIAVNIRNMEEWFRFKKANIPNKNVIAFTGTKDSPKELFDLLHAHKISCIFGTLGNIDKKAAKKGQIVYWNLLQKGVDVFATDTPEAVFQAIKTFHQNRTSPAINKE